MNKTMIVGDPHLGGMSVIGKPVIGSQLNSRVVDQFNILEWILHQAIDHEVSTIIITGDVFDHPKPPSEIVVLLIEWLKRCSDANISVHIILGNHDLLRSGQQQFSSLDIITAAEIENIFVYKTINTIHIDDVSFTLMPFRDRRSFNTNSHDEAISILQSRLPYELAEINRNNMKCMIGHLAIEGSIPALNEIDDTINELFCPIEMFKDYDYTFFGHIHKHQILNRSPYVSHIGSLDISNFGETDQDKLIAIIDPSKSTPYEYIKIPTRSLNQVSISVPENIIDATAYVLKELENNKDGLAKSIVKLNITLDSPDVVKIDRTAIENYLTNDIGVYHTARVSEERRVATIRKNTLDNSIDNTVNEAMAIKLYADENVEEEIKDDFIQLANNIVKECA
jgi:DNA repair exonuclease SbcCD nuclease subunit